MKKIDIKRKTTCKVCGKLLPFRYRRYCSKKCRNKEYYRRYYDYRLNYAREKRGEYASNKKRCIICGKWYIQVGTHIALTHQITAKEYRKIFDLPIKRGILPEWYRKIKRKDAIEKGGYKNLLTDHAKKTRFKKGDLKAKLITGWKGRLGGKKRKPDEYWE